MIEFIKEFLAFAVARKKLIYIPLLLIFLLIGLLIVFGETTALSPFIYTLF